MSGVLNDCDALLQAAPLRFVDPDDELFAAIAAAQVAAATDAATKAEAARVAAVNAAATYAQAQAGLAATNAAAYADGKVSAEEARAIADATAKAEAARIAAEAAASADATAKAEASRLAAIASASTDATTKANAARVAAESAAATYAQAQAGLAATNAAAYADGKVSAEEQRAINDATAKAEAARVAAVAAAAADATAKANAARIAAESAAATYAQAQAGLAATNAAAYADDVVTAAEARAIADATAKANAARIAAEAAAAAYANTQIGNIAIGGRNLYRKTTIIGPAGVSTAHLAARLATGFQLVGTFANDGHIRMHLIIPSNGTYTMSFDLHVGSMAGFALDIDVCDGPVQTINPTTTPQHFELTFTVSNWSAQAYHFIDFTRLSEQHYFFNNFQVERGNKATAAGPAPEDVASDIALAQLAADAAMARITSIGADGVLDRSDKVEIELKFDVAYNESGGIIVEAQALGVATANYSYHLGQLQTYLANLPGWGNHGVDTAIVRTEFNSKFQNYYIAKELIRSAITAKAATTADIVTVLDRDRTISRPPSYYPMGTTREFKNAPSFGLPANPATDWFTLETIKQYRNAEGGFPGYQYAYHHDKTYRRRSVDDAGSAWSAWVLDLDRGSYTGDLNASYGAPTGSLIAGTPAETVAAKANGAIQPQIGFYSGLVGGGSYNVNPGDTIGVGASINPGGYSGSYDINWSFVHAGGNMPGLAMFLTPGSNRNECGVTLDPSGAQNGVIYGNIVATITHSGGLTTVDSVSFDVAWGNA